MFSSLQQLIFNVFTTKSTGNLLQILASSENLEILQCKLSEDVKVEQLAPTFLRVRKLVITIPSPHTELARSVVASLHDSQKLQNLSLMFTTNYLDEILDKVPIVLPELLILWSNCLSAIEQIYAPRLSLLDITVLDYLDYQRTLFGDLDFASTKHLYVKRCYQGYCISGSKYYTSCKLSARSLNASEGFQDVLPHNWPRDCFCFHIKLEVFEGYNVFKRSQDVLLDIRPRLTNLTSLYLSVPDSLYDLEQLLTMFPMIENLVIDDGDNAMNFIDILHDTALCRCLKELSYITYWIPRNLENHADNIGKELTKCLQLRKKNDAHQLKSIHMDNCPPLSNIWLEELQKLGTEVMTAKNVQSVKRRTQLLTTDQ
ncbi:hypothetical protein Clacol_004068 [Clathrus columnatus]|uniref:Uncharacterized protein n=1 Tax=Clathrus columnatus TaxID=1419009 RepID=A0AAV5A9F0_9AGAM|nr:hypothetical protein Clacol_004068 [Clathrus columnatus]